MKLNISFYVIVIICFFSPTLGISGFYGNPINSDGLMPLSIGRLPGAKISYRFKSQNDGIVEEIIFYIVFKNDKYYSGDGGKVLLEVVEDDHSNKHLPSNNVLGSAIIENPMGDGEKKYSFENVEIKPNLIIAKGKIYHIVFSNISEDPIKNWVSLNNIYNIERKTNVQPKFSDEELAALLKFEKKEWKVNYGFTPIFCVKNTNGMCQGQGYIDAWISDTKLISNANYVSQEFQINKNDIEVQSVSIRLRKEKNVGSLKIILKDSENKILGTETLSSKKIKDKYNWVKLNFKNSMLLKKGSEYSLIVQAINGGEFYIYPVQKGERYGFKGGVFRDGSAKYSNNYGKSWEYFRGSTDGDLQFYFDKRIKQIQIQNLKVKK